MTLQNLITKIQSGFRPGDSTVDQLIDLVKEIHKDFDNKKSLEVRALFLDMTKASDKVWHEGLMLFRGHPEGGAGFAGTRNNQHTW